MNHKPLSLRRIVLSPWFWLLVPLLYIGWELATVPTLWQLHRLKHIHPQRYPFRVPRRRRPPSAVSASEVLVAVTILLPAGLAISFTRGFRLLLNGSVQLKNDEIGAPRKRIPLSDGLVIGLLRGFFAAVAWVAAVLLWLSSSSKE